MNKSPVKKPASLYKNRTEGKDFFRWVDDWNLYLRSIGRDEEGDELMHRWFMLKTVLRRITMRMRETEVANSD